MLSEQVQATHDV